MNESKIPRSPFDFPLGLGGGGGGGGGALPLAKCYPRFVWIWWVIAIAFAGVIGYAIADMRWESRYNRRRL